MTFASLLAAHLVADFFLQNEWMSNNKANPRHVAGYVHAGLHGLCVLPFTPWWVALVVAVSHFFIDLRAPLLWWGRLVKQSPLSLKAARAMTPAQSEGLACFFMLRDQAAHIIVLAAVVAVPPR